MNCPRCQSANEETQKFCGSCGGKLGMSCSRCANAILPSDKFCGACGLDRDKAQDYKVTAGEARHPGEPPGALCERLNALVSQEPDLCKSFADEVAKAVHIRSQNIRARLNRDRIKEGYPQ
jgi:hypothetical protein